MVLIEVRYCRIFFQSADRPTVSYFSCAIHPVVFLFCNQIRTGITTVFSFVVTFISLKLSCGIKYPLNDLSVFYFCAECSKTEKYQFSYIFLFGHVLFFYGFVVLIICLCFRLYWLNASYKFEVEVFIVVK